MTPEEQHRLLICSMAALLVIATPSGVDRDGFIERWRSLADQLLVGNAISGTRATRQAGTFRSSLALIVATARKAIRP